MSEFILDTSLEADSHPITRLPLCQVRLMKDANYPWLLAVPERAGLIEIIDLSSEEQTRLMAEIAQLCEALRAVTGCHKLNVAALGNQVPQLHVHIIARFETDAAWPGPVWGAAPPITYQADESRRLITALGERLSED